MRCFAIATLFAWCACALGQEPPYPIKVQGVRAGKGAVVRAVNEGPIPVSLVVSFDELTNLESRTPVPILAVASPGTHELTWLLPIEGRKGWGYKLRYRYRFGSYEAAHDPQALYRVPWLDGRTYVIGQAPGGKIITHHSPASRNAVDIPMKEGTPVLAARAGIVFQTVANNDSGGTDEIYRTKANVVRVMHDDGTIGNYVHLMHEGVAVKVGEKVEAGKLLGFAGNTGLSSGPHLHFAVTRVIRKGDELDEVSEPFRFYVGRPPRPFTPQSGLVVKADYSSPGIEPQVLKRPRPANAPAP